MSVRRSISPLRAGLMPVVLLGAALSLPLASPLAAQTAPAIITVTGEGSVEAAPDIATLSLGVTTQGATAAEAMAANTAAMQAVLDRLTAVGIEARDMQTSALSMSPNWASGDNGAEPRIAGYIAANQLTVRVRAIETLGTVLDAAISDGANTLNGLEFGLAEPRPAMDAARRAAVADALARATLLAEAAGVKLGRIQSITEGGGGFSPAPMYRADAALSAVPVAGGEVSTSASVTLVVEIAP